MKIIAVALIIGLVLATAWLGASVVKLENYRQANLVGMCSHYNIEDPIQRVPARGLPAESAHSYPLVLASP